KLIIPASAIDWSAAGPIDAPVYKLILKSSLLPRFANACGNTFGSPNKVKPLIPIVIPSSIQDAASSAETTLSKKSLFLIFSFNLLSINITSKSILIHVLTYLIITIKICIFSHFRMIRDYILVIFYFLYFLFIFFFFFFDLFLFLYYFFLC